MLIELIFLICVVIGFLFLRLSVDGLLNCMKFFFLIVIVVELIFLRMMV